MPEITGEARGFAPPRLSTFDLNVSNLLGGSEEKTGWKHLYSERMKVFDGPHVKKKTAVMSVLESRLQNERGWVVSVFSGHCQTGFLSFLWLGESVCLCVCLDEFGFSEVVSVIVSDAPSRHVLVPQRSIRPQRSSNHILKIFAFL